MNKVSQEIIQLLKQAQLCDTDAEARFQFLLLDRASQGTFFSFSLSSK